MTSIIIGRSPYGQQKQIIEAQSVSKRHAELTKIADGRWKLRDIGSTYGTSVNGMPIVETFVDLDTPIMLANFATSVRQLLGGNTRSAVMGDNNQNVSAQMVSVQHLERVYDEYQNAVKRLVKKKARASVMRMLPMSLLMPLALGASGIFIKGDGADVIKGAITIGIMGLTSLLSLRMISISNNQADEQFELTQQFQIDYVCPHCKNFFGMGKPYRALINQGKCPYCKSEFRESKRQ